MIFAKETGDRISLKARWRSMMSINGLIKILIDSKKYFSLDTGLHLFGKSHEIKKHQIGKNSNEFLPDKIR